MTLYITYDNETQQDGLGAQALRITGIYAIAKVFGIRYTHSPILKVIEEYSHKLDSHSDLQAMIEKTNKFFAFPDAAPPKGVPKIIKIRNPGVKQLLSYRLKYLLSKEEITLAVLLPFGVTDRWPILYTQAIRYLRKLNHTQLNSQDFVVAHVRWGYGYFYSDQNYIRPRHLPFSYFTDVLRQVSLRYFKSSSFKIVVHTDLSPKDTTWRPAQQQVMNNYRKLVSQSSKEQINIPGVDISKKVEFPLNSEVTIKYCHEFFETFLDMCTCKILVQGTSAFSYLAGLINSNTVIWPAQHKHKKIPRWISANKFGVSLREEMMIG